MFFQIFYLWATIAEGSQNPPHFSLKQITAEQGLESNQVIDIAQDRDGFMWFATRAGLVRFDGHDFKAYRHSETDPFSVPSELVYALLLDANGVFWVGTEKGLCRYLPERDGFERVMDGFFNGRVFTMLADEQNRLWLGTDHGAYLLDVQTLSLVENLTQPFFPGTDIKHLCFWQQNLYLGGYQGVSRLNLTTLQEEEVDALPKLFNTIIRVVKGRLWIGFSNTLYFADEKEGFFQAEDSQGMCVTDILPLEDGLLIGNDCNQGLYYSDHRGENRRPLEIGSSQGGRNQLIRQIFRDRTGTLWMGTFDQGLYYGDLRETPFRHAMAGKNTWAILQDRRGQTWYGTLYNGIHINNAQGNTIKTLRHRPGDGLTNDRITCLLEDREGTIWAGTLQGMNRIDPDDFSITHYRHGPENSNGLSDNAVWRLVDDPFHNLIWAATYYGGLNAMSSLDGRFRAFRHNPEDPNSLADDRLRMVLPQARGRVWVASHRGLNLLDPDSGLVRRFQNQSGNSKSLSHDIVSDIHLDRKGRLWVATFLNGFQRFDESSGDFTRFGTEQGLGDLCVYGILEDQTGFLWLSGNTGLTRFDPENGVFRQFGAADGLLAGEYNQGAFYQGADNRLYFGGIHGVTSVDPRRLQGPSHPPTPALTGLRVFNERVSFGEGRQSLLNTPLNQTPVLQMSHKDYHFSIEFSALHYGDPTRNRFAYILDGHDDRWIQTDAAHRLATFTRVVPGEYTFRLRAANKDGVWSEEPISLGVIITPPFWKTWWFRLMVLAAVLGLLALFHRLRLGRLIAIERLRTQIASDLHDDVGSMVTNIATQAQILEMSPSLPDSVRQKIANMSTNARDTIAAFGDIIWSLDRHNDDSQSLVSRIRNTCHKLTEGTQAEARIHTSGLDEPIPLAVEIRHEIYLIFKEALHNALKHAKATQIEVSLVNKKTEFRMSIKDNGVGFNGQATNGHGLRNMANRAGRLGGTLQADGASGGTITLVMTHLSRATWRDKTP